MKIGSFRTSDIATKACSELCNSTQRNFLKIQSPHAFAPWGTEIAEAIWAENENGKAPWLLQTSTEQGSRLIHGKYPGYAEGASRFGALLSLLLSINLAGRRCLPHASQCSISFRLACQAVLPIPIHRDDPGQGTSWEIRGAEKQTLHRLMASWIKLS